MISIPFGKPIIGDKEKQAVLDVLNTPILVHGPKAKEFEANFASYTGAKYAVSVSSCTAAMHLAYFYLNLGVGDEVIVPAQTHIATANSVELCGAKPVFVDSELETGNIDINQIESLISNKTKAIAIVHYLGMPVDMEKLIAIAKKHELFILEDCALSIGSRIDGKHTGLFGDVGCFSFYPVKHMTTAEGGMLITNNKNIAETIGRQKAFGLDRHVGERKVAGLYDVNMLGLNYRMNEIQATIGIEQLKRMDEFIEARQTNYNDLMTQLSKINEITLFKSSYDAFQSSYYCLSILLTKSINKKRFEIIKYLKDRGIGTSIYYPRPVPHMTYYKTKYGYQEDSFPVASQISYDSIALPVGPHITLKDIKYIVENLKSAIMELR